MVTHYKGQSELLCHLHILKASLHYSYLRNEVTGHIERRQLDTDLIVFNFAEDTIRDTLGSLAFIVSREHAVDVSIVDSPESLFDVNGIRITTGYYKYLLSLCYPSFRFHLLKLIYKKRAYIYLLIFVTSHAA